MSNAKDAKWAKALLDGIEKEREKANRDQRSTASYWNADDWGSISGIRDAEEWVENQIIKYVLKHARRKSQKAKST
jgi:hypothetical protein